MKSTSKKFDLRKNYPLVFELGLICALLLSIAALKFNIPVPASSSHLSFVEEEPPIVLSPITIQKKTPPPPVLARIPVSVPNDTPLDAEPIEFPDFEESGSAIALPPEINTPEETEILEQVEFMPEMKGGIKSLYSDITYPEAAKRSGVEGLVVVQFVINKQGEVENPVIIRGIGAGCDEEVLRALKLQSFTPGIQNGNLVKVRMQQVVRFILD